MGVAQKGRIQNDSCSSDQLDVGSRDGWGRTGVGKDKSLVTDVVHVERMVQHPRADGRWMFEPGVLGRGLC